MIIKIHRSGKSFAGVSRYLMGKSAEGSERVPWTHTFNLAETEHIPTAVSEMVWTYRAADYLKRAAGIGTGGDRVEKPVKHFTLAWHESTHSTKEHMIETVARYLKHMGWDDRQAILFAHDDRRHPHVHVVLNCISPEDGRTINTFKEYIRTEVFGLQYEQEQDLIFCEQRLKNRDEREGSPNRPMWERMKAAEAEHDRTEATQAAKDFDFFTRGDAVTAKDKEWELLKGHQRQQRKRSFVDGKQRFREVRNAVFKEVRTEFRSKWKDWYEAKREGVSESKLATMKKGILAEQNAAFDERKEAAFDALREERKREHDELLKSQQEVRRELTSRQAQGLRTYALLDDAFPTDKAVARNDGKSSDNRREELREQFQHAGAEVCDTEKEVQPAENLRRDTLNPGSPHEENFRVKGGADIAAGIGLGALGAVAVIGERLFDGFFGADTPSSPPKHALRRVEATEPEFGTADARKAVELGQKVANAEEAEQLRRSWEERRQRKRERD